VATHPEPSSRPGAGRGSRARQVWTIASIELRRVFFARRGLWVYALALLPAVIFFGHGVETKLRSDSLARGGLTAPALLDSVREGETAEDVKARLGEPAQQQAWVASRSVRPPTASPGTTTHVVEPAVEARLVRLNVTRASYSGDQVARIYEFQVYGPNGARNLALEQPVTGSAPCRDDRGPEKAVNGSVTGGDADSWCSDQYPRFLQVDLGEAHPVNRFVVKHASAGGESAEFDTRDFNIQVSPDGKSFATVETSSGAAFVEQRTEHVQLTYFDGRRQANLQFVDGRLEDRNIGRLLDFEEDRAIFAGIFQYFYLRLAIFFGCLGMFMYLFRGEMANRTLHYWLLAPARREVLLAGKFAAGLIAAIVIFGGGALLAFAAMVWPQDAVERQAYWDAGGMSHAFWYVAAAAFGCLGYGSVFLAAGLYARNPMILAAVLLAWESIQGILPHALQRISVLYYLQSLSPVPAPMDGGAPTVIQLLAAPAAPASRPGAMVGLLLLTALVLWIASRAVRRMEISYGGDS
jgi:hypothetical protein